MKSSPNGIGEIDEKTRELLAREPEKAGRNVADIREHIAHKERARKIKDLGLSRLQALWDEQMTAGERASLRQLASERVAVARQEQGLAEKAVTWAEEHLFERRSVVQEHELWRHALEHARGQEMSLADIQAFTRQREYLRDERQPGKVTTKELLGRELEIVNLAKEGIGRFRPFSALPRSANPQLDAEQREAVEQILGSRDLVTLFRGGAGTGKSFTLAEVTTRFATGGPHRPGGRPATPTGDGPGKGRLPKCANGQRVSGSPGHASRRGGAGG